MALIVCKDCYKKYSSDLANCLHCGANKPEKPVREKTSTFAKLVAIIAIPYMISLPFRDKAPLSASAPTITIEEDAQLTCYSAVKRSLHDPASADFDLYNTYPVKQEKVGTMFVQVNLRARNGFNAMRRMVVNCRVQKQTNGDWKILSLKEL